MAAVRASSKRKRRACRLLTTALLVRSTGRRSTLLVTHPDAGDETGRLLQRRGDRSGGSWRRVRCSPPHWTLRARRLRRSLCKPCPSGWLQATYNHDRLLPEHGDQQQDRVWFDLVPNASRPGDLEHQSELRAIVRLVLRPGWPEVMSVVIHNGATDHRTGAAGTRQACFPLVVADWAS